MTQLATKCEPTFRPTAVLLRWDRVDDGKRALTATALSLTVRRGSEGLSLMLLTDFTTRGLPGSFWRTRMGSSAPQLPLTLPGFEGCCCPPGGSPSPSRGLWSLQGGSPNSSKEPRGTPAALAEPGFEGGLILMTMF